MENINKYIDTMTLIEYENVFNFEIMLHELKKKCKNEDCVNSEFTEKIFLLFDKNKKFLLSDNNQIGIQHFIVNFVSEIYPVSQWELFKDYVPFYTKNVDIKENYQHIINLNLNFCDNIYPTFLFSHYFSNIIPQLTEIMSSDVVKDFLNIKDFVYVTGLNNPTRFFTFVVNSSEKEFNKDLVIETLHQFLKEYDLRDYITNKIDADLIVEELTQLAPNLLQYIHLENITPTKELKHKPKKI